MEAKGRSSQFEKALLELRALILGGAFESNVRLPETALAQYAIDSVFRQHMAVRQITKISRHL